jgi:GTP pyrophosphokinase
MTTHPRSTKLGERFDRAIAYALATHRLQYRKESNVPYTAHLLGVCAIALEFGATEDEAMAALLHDAVEDCGGTPRLEDIRERFGSPVADIVAACSDSFEADAGTEKQPWYDRKRAYIDELSDPQKTSESALLVSASDKLYNALTIMNDVGHHGPSVYERFKSRKFGTLWYYRSLADAYGRRTGRHAAICGQLGKIVDELAGKAVSAHELLAAFAIDDSVNEREKGGLTRVGPT